MQDTRKINRKYYASPNVPLFIAEYLRDKGAVVFSHDKPDGYPMGFSKKSRRQSILLTTDIEYLSSKSLSEREGKLATIVLRPQEKGIPFDYGAIIYGFVEYLGQAGIKKLTDVTIEISSDVKVYIRDDKLIKSDIYKIVQTNGNDYLFERNSTHYDFSSYTAKLLLQGNKKGYLTFDDIYNTFPDHIVNADLVDEVATSLADKGINVFTTKDEYQKSLSTTQTEIDYELLSDERDIDKALKDLYAGAYEYDGQALQTQGPYLTDKKAKPIETISAKVTAPNIPHLSSVMPNLTDNASLLVSRDRNSNKRNNSLRSRQIANAYTVSLTDQDANGEEPQNFTIPKLYDSPKFNNDRRLSLYAGIVGRRAEEIVIKLLQETLQEEEKRSIRWTSALGKTPGWDIDYIDSDGRIIGIEVKGTTGTSFPNVEITCNEWDAACELQDRFWLYLVTKCFSASPRVQRMQNPAKMKENGDIIVSPVLWKLELKTSNTRQDQ